MSEDSEYTKHPISLKWIAVRELRFLATRRGARNLEIEESDFQLGDSHSPFDEQSQTIQVNLRGEIGSPDNFDKLPFYLLVELVGTFQVDLAHFPIAKVELWADKVAPFVVYPFLREHVYALTTRSGYPSVTIPLLEVPSLKQSDLKYIAEQKRLELEQPDLSSFADRATRLPTQ